MRLQNKTKTNSFLPVKMTLNNEKVSVLPSIFIALGFAVGFINALNPSASKLIEGLIMSILGVVFAKIPWTTENTKQFRQLLIIVLVAWLFIVTSVLLQGGNKPLRLATLAYMLYTVFVSFVLIKSNIVLLPIKVVFYAISAYLIFQLMIVGALSSEVLFFSAGGMMTTILLSIAVPVQLLDYRRNGKISLIPPIIIFMISIFCYSRTAMICSALYLIFILWAISFKTTNKKLIGIILFGTVAIIATYEILLRWEDIVLLEIYTKFDDKGLDTDGRNDLWSYYLGEIDLIYFILGRNIDESHMIRGLANSHNSFIQLHSQTGVLGFVFVVYYIKVLLYYFRRDFFSFMLAIVLVIRCFFDSPYFFNVYDFALIVFLLDYKEQTLQLLSNKQKLTFALL